jgi:hypothetical protein
VAVLGQGRVQQAAPQLTGAALGQRPGLGGEPFEAGSGPGGGAAWGGQALGDEQGADAVLDGDAAADEGLAVGDQGTPLAGPGGGRQTAGSCPRAWSWARRKASSRSV